MTKLLIAVFSILLIFILGELTFIFVFHSKLPYPAANTAPTETIVQEKKIVYSSPDVIPNSAVDQSTLFAISHWQKGVLTSAKVTPVFNGIISELNTQGGYINENGTKFNYKLGLTIKGSNGLVNDFYWNEEEIQKTSFKILDSNGKESVFDYNQLKVGDKLNIQITFDLTKNFDNNFISAEVTKE